MKSFRTFLLNEKINYNYVGYSGKAPTMVGYAAKSHNFIRPEKESKAEKSPFVDQLKAEKPDPLKTRGKFHLYNKSSKQVTTKTQPFKKQKDAQGYLASLGDKSREHLEVIYHSKSGSWHKVNDRGIIDPVAVKILNKHEKN